MIRIYFVPVAVLLMLCSQAQAFHPCGGYTYHYRVHGHGVGAPPLGSGIQTFNVAPSRSPVFQSAPSANFQFVPTTPQFSFGFTQPQSLGTWNFNANPAATPSEALLPTTILDALKLACRFIGGGNAGSGGTTMVDLSPLTADIKKLSDDLKVMRSTQVEMNALIIQLHTKVFPGQNPSATPIIPKEMPKPGSLPPPKSAPITEIPCEFKQLRLEAERLAAESAVKNEVIVKASK